MSNSTTELAGISSRPDIEEDIWISSCKSCVRALLDRKVRVMFGQLLWKLLGGHSLALKVRSLAFRLIENNEWEKESM